MNLLTQNVKMLIEFGIKCANGNISHVARCLGCSPHALSQKCKRLEIEVSRVNINHKEMREVRRQLIIEALINNNMCVSKAARVVGVSRTVAARHKIEAKKELEKRSQSNANQEILDVPGR